MKTVPLLFLALFFAFCPSDSVAQKEKKKFKKANSLLLNDSLTTYSQSGMFDFPNVNKVRNYYDAQQFKKIHELDEQGKNEALYAMLKTYVSRFGIDNFTTNMPMLWKLASLSQKFGPPGESILLYKLAIKHYQAGININDLYAEYDSLEPDKKKYYVPLDFYFTLVNYRKEIDTLQPPHPVLENMGDLINSPKEDYGPTIGNADNVLLFTSKRNKGKDRKVDEDLFFSVRVDSQWTEAKEFKTINTFYNEGSACLSQDGKFLYFSRCDAPGGLGLCDIYYATLGKDSTWGSVKNLGPNINSTSWESQPSLSHHGDTLFFASNRVGGFGMVDIYYSIRNSNGEWQPAVNMGPIINTRGNEASPFFHHKHNVLYFSSDGHPLNFGAFDIYKTDWNGRNWSEPKNIGPLVNGAGSEYYFTIDSQSRNLYYARSTDDVKNLDLYSFPVPMEAQPLAVARFSGSLKGQDGKPMKGIVAIIDLDKGVEVAPKFLREDGTFDFSLINKRNYLLIIQGDDFFRIEEAFFMDGDKSVDKVAEPIESKIAFQSLEFENGKADILESMHADLDKLANFLVDHPQLKLKISGHTDSSGKEELNLKLSQARADAIKAYLTQQFNLDPMRIEAIGLGSSKPIVQEITDEHKQINRRVEFEITR